MRANANVIMVALQVPYISDFVAVFVSILVQYVPRTASMKLFCWRS